MYKTKKIVAIFLIIQIIFTTFAPITSYANDAYMIEVLIEPMTKTYRAEVIEDKPVWFGQHYERKTINFDSFYNKACGSGFSSDSFELNPTNCNSLDDTFEVSDESGQVGTYNGFDFMMKYEGFRNGSSLISNDNEIDSTIDKFSKIGTMNPSNSNADGLKVLTFPGMHGGGANDATEVEMERAINIGNTLSSNLNSMLAFINNGKRFDSVSELVNKSILIRPTSKDFTIIKGDGNAKDFIIVYGTLESYNGNDVVNYGTGNLNNVDRNFNASSFWNDGKFPNVDYDGNLLAYVIPIVQNNISYDNVNTSNMDMDGMASFVWSMPKGYTRIPGIENSLMFRNDKLEEFSYISEDNDVPWITMHHITTYANNAYKNYNLTIGTKNSIDDSGNILLQMIAGLLKGFMTSLRAVLGMTDAYDLIFNRGVRGSSSYNYGSMSDSWWTVVLRYHIIFQSLAWFLIIVGLIKTLIDLNISTINPGKRLHTFKTIQRFVIVGFLLVLVIPMVQFFLNFNNVLVQIFASQADPNSMGPPVVGSLGGIVLQFAYFGIVVFMNFLYIMRSVIIGLLVVTAPFFIASMAFSENSKQLFVTWFRELTANIFMQTIHAFTMAFLTNLVITGGGLESIVIAYSIIPITELIRGLIFAGAGSGASNLANTAGQKYMNTVKGMTTAVAGMGANAISDRMSAGDAADGQGQGQGSTSGTSKGKDGPVAGLAKSIDSRINEIQNSSKENMGSDHASPQDVKAAKSNIFKGNVAKGALATAKGATALASAATTSATADMSNNMNAYNDVGSSLGSIGGGAVGVGAKGMAKGAGALGGGSSPQQSMNTGNPSNFGLLPKGTIQDSKTGNMIDRYSGASRGNATYSNHGRDLVENIGSKGIDTMANSNTSAAPFYQDVKRMTSGNLDSDTYNKMNEHYENLGVQIQRGQNGNASIVYGDKFMQAHGIESMSATKDKKDFLVRSSQGGNPFVVSEGLTYGNKSGL